MEKRRKAFWGTNLEGIPKVWAFIQEHLILEEDNMKAMLEANEKTPLKRFINVTYDKSEEVYEIPNYCKNEFVCYDYPDLRILPDLFFDDILLSI